jgi:hypothetical protein
VPKRFLGSWRVGSECEVVVERLEGPRGVRVVVKVFSLWFPSRRLVWTETYRPGGANTVRHDLVDAVLANFLLDEEGASALNGVSKRVAEVVGRQLRRSLP